MKKITAFCEKGDNEPFRILSKDTLNKETSSLPKGRYKLTIEKYFAKSTPKQFGWLYACVYPHSLIALNAEGYELTTIDQVDDFWKILFANKEVLNRETGEIIKLPLSKKEFETIDQMAYCESIRHHCAEYLGYSIPDPEKKKKPEII